MYRLRTLGGLAVERDGRPVDAMAAHRKALSILVLLAGHERLGRERISVLLWPESDAERARGSLKQAIHLLRRQFGEADLILGTSELRLNAALIESDAAIFQRALAAGDAKAAVDLYEGPFLDGVHLDGAPEFERWVDERRAEFFQGYTRTLEELASEAESRGDGSEALQWWRRLQGADPFNGRVAVRLMQSLDRGGDRAAALRHARVHEVLFREELGIPPDPGVLELAERLRAEPAPTSAPRSIVRGPEGGLAEAAPTDREGEEGPPNSSRAPMPPTAEHGPGGWSRTLEGRFKTRLLIPALAMAGLFLIGLWGVGSGRSPLEGEGGGGTGSPREGARAEVPVSLAVLPFVDMSPEGDQEYFSDGVTEEILNVLTQRTNLRIPARSSSFHFKGRNLPIREIAAQLGVEAVLEGSVRKSGDRVRITAQLIDAREDRHLWSETFDRGLEDIFVVQTEIAEIVAQELRVRLSSTDHRDGPATSQAPEAYDRYLRGLFHWNRRSAADLGLAIEFFQEATPPSTTLALIVVV